MNLSVFLWDFVCFENIPCKAFYSVKKGFGTIPKRCGIRSKSQHKCKKLALYSFWKSLYVRKIGPMYACRKLCAQVDSCMRIVRVSFGLIFQKLIYLFTKSYIFHFNTSQVNLTFD